MTLFGVFMINSGCVVTVTSGANDAYTHDFETSVTI